MSLALEVSRLAEAQVGRERLPRVVEVGLEVGADAGIEVDSFQFCLEAVLATPPFTGARPVIARGEGDVLRLAYLEVEE